MCISSVFYKLVLEVRVCLLHSLFFPVWECNDSSYVIHSESTCTIYSALQNPLQLLYNVSYWDLCCRPHKVVHMYVKWESLFCLIF